MNTKIKLSLFTLLAFSISFFSIFCNHFSGNKPADAYLNLSDTVQFVGMQTCRSCHSAIYDSYIKTGMGQSFHLATRAKSAAEFDGEPVYDSVNSLYYTPFWSYDTLFVKEFRLDQSDTTHVRVEKISYIIGSGQHTNSHICNFNGYLHQAPITFYTQEKRWDLAPGFEGGYNSRFGRPIGLECMTCHNGLPEFSKGSVNKYASVQTGIDCERCHGAGGEHVRRKLAGELIDTSKYIDYSIVNPAGLSRELQMSICQRCHLQGLAVLKEGKDFDDFKPGMHLHEVWDVFPPESKESRDKFIMASQAERLTMSKCYQRSELTCITCHNPHISVKETPIEVFNAKCQSCHQKVQCREQLNVRLLKNDNCSECHMEKSSSIDIPHVFITDHFISKKNKGISAKGELEKVTEYLKLKCFTRERPPSDIVARAYLSFYEKFSPREYLLDSAAAYLFGKSEVEMSEEKVHYYFLRKDYESVIAQGNTLHRDSILSPWTYYRIGEAHFILGNFVPSREYFSSACEREPFNMEFQNKLGAVLSKLGKYREARSVFEKMIKEHPKMESGWSNLAFLMMRERDFVRAEELLEKALALNPDYEQALINIAALYSKTGRLDKAKMIEQRIMKLNPANESTKRLSHKSSLN